MSRKLLLAVVFFALTGAAALFGFRIFENSADDAQMVSDAETGGVTDAGSGTADHVEEASKNSADEPATSLSVLSEHYYEAWRQPGVELPSLPGIDWKQYAPANPLGITNTTEPTPSELKRVQEAGYCSEENYGCTLFLAAEMPTEYVNRYFLGLGRSGIARLTPRRATAELRFRFTDQKYDHQLDYFGSVTASIEPLVGNPSPTGVVVVVPTASTPITSFSMFDLEPILRRRGPGWVAVTAYRFSLPDLPKGPFLFAQWANDPDPTPCTTDYSVFVSDATGWALISDVERCDL